VKGYFITGTDTGVGKTFVTATLAQRATERGTRVFAFKPIETGCLEVAGELVGADQQLLVEAAGGWQTGQLVGLYRFQDPVAPWMAAGETAIDLGLIKTTLDSTACDLQLVEGAGGWRVPITATEDMSDLARLVDFPIVLVGRAGLGTINHTLLSLEVISRDGCEVAAVVLSCLPTDSLPFARANAAEIARRWTGCVLLLTDSLSLDSLL